MSEPIMLPAFLTARGEIHDSAKRYYGLVFRCEGLVWTVGSVVTEQGYYQGRPKVTLCVTAPETGERRELSIEAFERWVSRRGTE